MESALLIVVFCFIAFCCMVVWLIAKAISANNTGRRVDDLETQLGRIDRRLDSAEESLRRLHAAAPSAGSQAPATVAVEPPTAKPSAKPAPVPPSTSQEHYDPLPAKAPAINAPARTPDPGFPGFASYPAPKSIGAASAPAARPAGPRIPPPPRFTAPTPEHPHISLEERLGRNWLNKLGIVILVIGLALFLGYQLNHAGPVVKSLTGLTLSATLLIGGVLLERCERYRIFARAAIGGGWALTFFVSFALYHVTAMKVLDSQATDLVLMLGVATAMVTHSLRYKSQVITSLAFLLAFITVGISQVTLFSLVAGIILAVGLIFVAWRYRWYELALCGIVGAYLNHFLWLTRVLPNGVVPGQPFQSFLPSAALLLAYWLLFRIFYVFRMPATHRQEVLTSIAAVLNFIGVMSLLKYQSTHPEWAFYALLVFGAAELLFAFLARPRFRSAFILLSCIGSIVLAAAIPFHFGGASWPMLWLLEGELLLIAGITLHEAVLYRLGALANLAAALVWAIVGVAPIVSLRATAPDHVQHLAAIIAGFLAATLFWTNAEALPRRWRFLVGQEPDRMLLTLMSYFGAAIFATTVWIIIPGAWTAVAWLAATIALSLVADKLTAGDFAAQTDLLALTAIARLIAFNFQLDTTSHLAHLSVRAVTVTLSAALLYANMRRRTQPSVTAVRYVPALYATCAAGLLTALFWYELAPEHLAVAWSLFGLLLFELGLRTRSLYFRLQSYTLLTLSFLHLFANDLDITATLYGIHTRTLIGAVLATIAFWSYVRLTTSRQATEPEQKLAPIAAWLGTVVCCMVINLEVRYADTTISIAALTTVLLALAAITRRGVFLAQSLTGLTLTALRVIAVDVNNNAGLALTNPNSRAFVITLTCATLLLALPFAFVVRKQHADEENNEWMTFFYRPEQPFFFLPLLLLIGLCALELHAGSITIGWAVLGITTFLFALIVKERSYRLGGLALLLLAVGKVLIVDIWQSAPTDRYLALIVTGAGLLLVSFLYSRYKETILKLL